MRRVVQAFLILAAGVGIGVMIAPATIRHKCVVRSTHPINPQVTVDYNDAGNPTVYTYEK